jgi:O-antigen/teichoic acid export membrane protein
MVIGNTIGIVLAFKGFGVWALVFRLLSQRIIFSVFIWPVAGWFPVKPKFAGIGKLFRFGANMLGSNVLYYFSQNMAALITGKFIGVETLGSFNIAYNLAIVPAQKIQSILTGVLGPAFAKIQTDLIDFKKKFSVSIFSLGVFFIPAMLGLAAVSQDFVVVVYGEKWREAGFFLTFLAIVGLVKGIEHLLRSAIIARGMASAIFAITAAETAVSLPLLFVGAYYFGVLGLIMAYVTASLFAFSLTLRTAQKSVEDNTIFHQSVGRSFVTAGIMFMTVVGYSVIIPSENLLTLCTQIVIGLTIYIPLRMKLLSDEDRKMMKTWPAPVNRLSNVKS